MTDQIENTIALPSRVLIKKSQETEHYARFVVKAKPEFVPPHTLIDDFEHMRELGLRAIYCHAGELIFEKVTP